MTPTTSNDRLALLHDAEHHASELVRCLEALVDIERSKHTFGLWQQAAALVRGVLGLVRHEADATRRALKRHAQRAANRTERQAAGSL